MFFVYYFLFLLIFISQFNIYTGFGIQAHELLYINFTLNKQWMNKKKK